MPEIQVVSNKADFVNALTDFRYDVILSDHSLASFDSLEAIRLVKKAGITVPFILVTASMSDVFAAEIMREGACDYILKDRLSRLPSAIINSIEKHGWEERQHAANERLAFHIENTPLGFIEWDNELHIKTLSKRAEEIFGWTLAESLANERNGYSQVYEEDMPTAIKALKDLATGLVKRNTVQHRNITKDGRVIWCEWFNSVLKNGDGKVVSIMSLVQDITAHQIAEEKLNNANRLYSFISQINQSIVHVNDEKALFKNACSIALKFGKFKIAWIGLFGYANKTISNVNQIGITPDDIEQFKDVPLEPNGPQQQVLNTGNYYICNDIMNDPELESWKPLAIRQGVCSCMILPIKKSGNVIGTFNLYAEHVNFFDKEEIALLKEVTGDISFALDAFEKEKVHRHTEELIVQNEKRFRSLIEKSADMLTLAHPDGELIYVSAAVTKVLGYPAEELLRTSVFDIIHPDDIPGIIRTRDEVVKAPGKSCYYQQRRRHKNGTWVWCEGTLTNMLNEPGINALVSNFRDVSQKKKADVQQEFDRNNLDALINNTNDLMWSVDMNFNIITSNQPFNDIIKLISGKTVAEGVSILDAAFSIEESKRYKVFYKRAFAGESFTEIVHNDALIDTWSEISYYPIRKGDEIIGTACHSRNITEKIKAEQQLVQSESRLKEAQAIAQLGNFEIDLTDHSEVWSDEMYNITGIDKEISPPSTGLFLSFIHPEDLNYIQTGFEECIKTFQDSAFDFRFIRKDGILRYGYTKTRFEFDKSQNPVRLFGIFQDVTEVKLAGIERIKMVNDLMLRNAELEQFGYIISHNLRAPVANIIGASSVLNDPDLSIADKEILNTGIMVSITRLDDVVKDLNRILDVKGDINDTKETVGFSALVDDIKISINNLIVKYHIEVKYNFRAINEFSTFKPYLYSIFYNLISNSIKYRRRQAHTVIEIKSRLKKNKMELIFSDNGMGIDLEKSGKDIFGLYKRFHPHIEGKGMGLFMVKTQVEALGGKISVQSAENEGTVFTIAFEL